LLKFIFLFWRLDGENVWTQNVIDRPLEDSKIITKGLSFFRDDTRNKSPLKGSKNGDNLYRFKVSVSNFSFP
jgi:hypothetical protein